MLVVQDRRANLRGRFFSVISVPLWFHKKNLCIVRRL